jgi:hypothetical protein
MSGFAFSYAANTFILMILYDFCLLLAQFGYIMVFIRKIESLGPGIADEGACFSCLGKRLPAVALQWKIFLAPFPVFCRHFTVVFFLIRERQILMFSLCSY